MINPREIATELCIAVSLNDVSKISLTIESNIPITFADYDGRSALHIASDDNHEEIVHILIDAGADGTLKDNFGNIPNYFNKKYKNTDELINKDIVELIKIKNNKINMNNEPLLDKKLTLDKNIFLCIIMCNLIKDGNLETLKDFCKKIENIKSIKDYDYRTPLHIAAVKDQ